MRQYLGNGIRPMLLLMTNRKFHMRFRLAAIEEPREYPHKHYIARNYSHCASSTHVFWHRMRNGPSRPFKVTAFGINRKRVFVLFVINRNLGPILPRFRDIAGFLLRRATSPLFHPNFGAVPRGLYCWCWGAEIYAKTLSQADYSCN